ncbi:MAG: acyltransferase, partial [Phycisphaerae bacterium]|nr:acyltransferase [Phycisphaerae bacterium]
SLSGQTDRARRPRLADLDLLRVVAMFFVMLIHSPVTGGPQDRPVLYLVKDFLAGGAVPAFFLLSGCLAAKKIHDPGTSAGVWVREKLRTLAVPFVFWNGLVLSLVFLAKALHVDTAFRSSGGYFDVEPTWPSMVAALLGVGRAPIAYQFWFIRDLFVVSMASFWVCRFLPAVPLLPWMLFFVPVPMASSMAYFLLGVAIQPCVSAWRGLGWAPLGTYCTVWILLGLGTSMLWTPIPYPLRQIGSAVFLFFVSLLAARATWGQRLAAIGSSTFLIFALHEPLQTCLAKTWLARAWPWYGSFFCFLLIPLAVLPLCVLAYAWLRRRAPWLLPVLTGSR